MQSCQAAMPRPRHVPMQQPTTAVSVPWDPNVRRKRAAGCWWGGTLGKDSSTSAGCAKAAGCWACPARRRQCGLRVGRKLHSCLYGGAGLHVDGRGLQLGRPKLERHLQGGRGSSRNVWVEVGGRAANTVRRAACKGSSSPAMLDQLQRSAPLPACPGWRALSARALAVCGAGSFSDMVARCRMLGRWCASRRCWRCSRSGSLCSAGSAR